MTRRYSSWWARAAGTRPVGSNLGFRRGGLIEKMILGSLEDIRKNGSLKRLVQSVQTTSPTGIQAAMFARCCHARLSK